MPKISCIITTFNRCAFLQQAVESVLSQDFDDFELLILDNSSSDGTDEYAATLSDHRIQYVRHDEMGISEQRNMGIEIATGEFVAFLDDDDVWLPSKLSRQYNAFVETSDNLGLVYGGFEFYDDDGRRWGFFSPTKHQDVIQDLLWTKHPFSGSASNPMLRRQAVLAAGGYNEEVKAGEDWEMYLRLATNFAVATIAEKVLEIRQHNGPRLGDNVGAALFTDELVFDNFEPVMPRSLQVRYLQKIGGKMARLGQTRKLGAKWLPLSNFNL